MGLADALGGKLLHVLVDLRGQSAHPFMLMSVTKGALIALEP
jgi:hypothetical protein